MAETREEPDETAATATATGDASDAEPTPSGDAHDEPDASDGEPRGTGTGGERFDLRAALKQLTSPMLESLDARLREQVEAHADELLQGKVDAAVADRLSTVDRAIADLSRALQRLERRVEALERNGEPLDDA